MSTKEKRYDLSKLRLKEYWFYNGENYVIFNIVDINLDKSIINVAVTNRGTPTFPEYDLLEDKDGNLYFEYGCEHNQIYLDNFED